MPFYPIRADCDVSTDTWVTLDSNPTFYCSTASQYTWWQLSDTCQPDDATVLGNCTGASSCTISNDTLRDMTSHVLCCNDATISSSFVLNAVLLCFKIRGEESEMFYESSLSACHIGMVLLYTVCCSSHGNFLACAVSVHVP